LISSFEKLKVEICYVEVERINVLISSLEELKVEICYVEVERINVLISSLEELKVETCYVEVEGINDFTLKCLSSEVFCNKKSLKIPNR